MIRKPLSRPVASRELTQLRARLAVAEETLRAIRSGEVDSVLVAGKEGSDFFTLDGTGHVYRVLIESMNEGALTLTPDKTILYANQCFARMVKCPLEQVMGSSLRHFLSAGDLTTLGPLMKLADKSGSKIQVQLNARGGSKMPAQISIRPIGGDGLNRRSIGMVVTDMTEVRRTEELLRGLVHRAVQAHEAERGRVAVELHGHITQLLCAVLVRCQTLANRLSPRDEIAKSEAIKLRAMLGKAATEVERISRHLRPSVLDDLGLVPALCDISTEFAERVGVSLKLACTTLTARLPADTELTLFRILQEALKNVEQHAHASHVTVRLTKHGGGVQLVIKDDGIGFDPKRNFPNRQKGKRGLGLLSMRERASYVGGVLNITSAPRSGTKIEVHIPPPPKPLSKQAKNSPRYLTEVEKP